MRRLTNIKSLLVLLSTASILPSSGLAETVGIVQALEHPALDRTRQGIIDLLKEKLSSAEVSWDSAQGNAALAIQVTQKYLGNNAKVIVAIGTTPAQAALKLSKKGNTPVVYASVTDPKAARLSGNIAGISNFVALAPQLKMMSQILPGLKKIGVIYNPGEVNSETLLTALRQEAAQQNLEIVAVAAMKTSDVAAAAQQLSQKVDCIFINNDNTALSAFSCIVKSADACKIPVFASDTDLIDQGAIAVLGPDQYEIGRQAGEMIVALLKGEKAAADFEVGYPQQVELHLNAAKAKALEIILPPELCKQAKRISS